MSDSEDAVRHDHIQITRSPSNSDAIDPRIKPRETADEEQLDESYFQQASDYIHHHEHPQHSEKSRLECLDGPLYVCLMMDVTR